MKVTRHSAVQVHPVPDKVTSPQGPFPRELFREPEIITDYEPQYAQDGTGIPLGGTAQNNYKPPRWMRCGSCMARVLENETDGHVCED